MCGSRVPTRMGQPVKTAPLTNKANTMLSACATPSSNLAFFCLNPHGERGRGFGVLGYVWLLVFALE